MLKKPWIWPAMEIHGQDAGGTRRRHEVGDQLGADGYAG
jgi:hypothetical protein